MKIRSIEIKSFLGIDTFNQKIIDSTCFISGPNAAGKSSIQNAIRMALTGEPSRVDLKRDYGRLVKDENASAYICINNDEPIVIKKSGKTTGIVNSKNIDPGIKASLDTGYFTRKTKQERKQFLFELLGVSSTLDDIISELENLGIKKPYIQELMPNLSVGFDSAYQAAKKKTTESRGVWKGITGETYGVEKAEYWKPKDVNETSFDEVFLNHITLKIIKIEEDIYKNKTALSKDQIIRENMQELHSKMGNLDHNMDEYTKASDMLASEENKYRKCMEEIELLKEGIALRNEVEGIHMYTCPSCCKNLDVSNGMLVVHEPTKPLTPSIEELMEELKEISQESETVSSEIKRQKNIMTLAMANENCLEILNDLEQSSDILCSEERERIENLIEKETTRLDSLLQEKNKQIEARRKRDDAHQKIENARHAHKDVCQRIEIEKALSPNGLPSELLKKAIGPFNSKLKSHSYMAWGIVKITQEMDVTYGDRAYEFLSESERWRVDAMISATICEINELGFLMIDRADVLDSINRRRLFDWCVSLAKENIQTLLFATWPRDEKLEGIQHIFIEPSGNLPTR